MNYTKTSILFAAMLSLIITPVMMEDAFAAERIPGFMKTNIEWYAAGQISEAEFVNALTYLMNKDIIVLDQARADAIKELRDENAQLRKQMQTAKTDFGSMMKQGESKGADAAMSGAQTAAPFVPGGSVVSAAVSGMQNSAQVQNQISSVTGELSSLYDALALIMAQIEQHQANAPDDWDFSDNPERFQEAQSAWQSKMNDLVNQLSRVQKQIEQTIQKLEQLQGELSTAQQKDQAEMNKMMEQEREAMKQTTASHELGPENIQKKHIATTEVKVTDVKISDAAGVESRWTVFVTDMSTGDIPIDINALIQSVLRESYMETNKDLQFYADKVRHFNDMKEAIRDEVTKVRNERQMAATAFENANQAKFNPDVLNPDVLNPDLATSGTTSYDRLTMKADLDEHEGTISEFLELQKKLESAEADIQDIADRIQENLDAKKQLRADIADLQDIMTADRYPVKHSYYDENGRVVSVAFNSAGDAWNLAIEFDERLKALDDDAQLMNIDLQNAMQKQQQTLQTMSNVSKMLHDTAMAIIRKIG